MTIGLAPLDEIAPHILRLWKARQNDRQIIRTLWEKHIDTERYGIGYVQGVTVIWTAHHYHLIYIFRLTKFREIWESMGLQRTRQQGHTIESIHDTMINIRQMYPKAGIREVISLLFHEKSMSISRSFF